jgi:hypothetical protein
LFLDASGKREVISRMDGCVVETVAQDGDGCAARSERRFVGDGVDTVRETGHDDESGSGKLRSDAFGRLRAVGGMSAWTDDRDAGAAPLGEISLRVEEGESRIGLAEKRWEIGIGLKENPDILGFEGLRFVGRFDAWTAALERGAYVFRKVRVGECGKRSRPGFLAGSEAIYDGEKPLLSESGELPETVPVDSIVHMFSE